MMIHEFTAARVYIKCFFVLLLLFTSLAIVSSIVDCTLVWGGCCDFLQHKSRDQQA